MKTPRSTFLPLVALIAAVTFGSANASVLLTVGTSGWGNNTTTSTNGMTWGIVVSSTGAAFDSSTIPTLRSALAGFTIPATPSGASNPVQIGTSSYYFAEAQAQTSSSGPPSFLNGYMGADSVNLTGSVSSGNPFGVLWFSDNATTNGSHFGFQVPTGINTLPSNGSSITSGINTTPGLGSNVIGAPEPSRAVLAALGLGMIALRRRRR